MSQPETQAAPGHCATRAASAANGARAVADPSDFRAARPRIAAHRFLTDFGLQLAERFGADPVHAGDGIRAVLLSRHAGGEAELRRLWACRCAARRSCAVGGFTQAGARVEPCTHPGGGEMVRLTDPSGFIVEAACGQSPSRPQPVSRALAAQPERRAAPCTSTGRSALRPTRRISCAWGGWSGSCRLPGDLCLVHAAPSASFPATCNCCRTARRR